MHLRIMDAARRTGPRFINLGCQQFHDLLAYVGQSFLNDCCIRELIFHVSIIH